MLPLDVAGTNADIIMAQMFYHDNFSTLLNWSTTVLTAVRQADSTLATGGLLMPIVSISEPYPILASSTSLSLNPNPPKDGLGDSP